jgi:hypothetical protein
MRCTKDLWKILKDFGEILLNNFIGFHLQRESFWTTILTVEKVSRQPAYALSL